MKTTIGLILSAVGLSVSSEAHKPNVVLNNGLTFPAVSFGLQVYDDDTAEQYTTIALGAGIRNFFSSVLAGNQNGFGRAISKTSVARKDIFICGSVNTGNGICSGFDDCKSATAQGCAANMQDIGSGLKGYLDMIMLDYPASDCDSIRGQWAAFEDMLHSKQTKSIAVSNFSPDQLDCVLGNATAAPAVNQMPYSVGHGSDTTVADDFQRKGVIVQAYSPLGSGSLIGDPDCIAIGKAHNKTSAQVALRWIIERNATFTTSASTSEHFSQDLDIFDFQLTPAEMATLNAK